MDEVFVLKYDGLTASQGEMDAYDAADALRGFADFSRRVAEGVYGKKIELRTTVRDIRHGSLEIELLNHLLSPETVGLLATIYEHGPSVLKIVLECIKLFKHLQGQPPSNIKKAENGSVFVENNSGTIINVNQLTLNVVLDEKAGRAVQNFVKRPLERSADKLMIMNDNEEVARITHEESRYFGPIDGNDLLTEHTSEMYLKIATTVFEGKSRWKFHDGRNPFFARIDDQSFLDRVERGQERFGRGDTLLVRLRAMQKKANGSLKAEYVIEEVLDHIPTTSAQGSLF